MSKKNFPGDKVKAREHLRALLEYLGEDPEREGLKRTPERILGSWERIFGGYLIDVKDVFTTFEEDSAIPYHQIILLKNIDLFSTCEHHFLPFTGKAHVAYIPTDKIVGVSKLARIVEVFSRRLQIQERIGNQVTEALMKHLNAEGAACIIEATHSCMTCRGVEKQNSIMVTSSLRGSFMDDAQTRNELLTLIRS